MKKADYSTLAQLIREGHAFATVQRDSEGADAYTQRYHQGRIDACAGIARRFAKGAHVDPVEFLKACGIDP